MMAYLLSRLVKSLLTITILIPVFTPAAGARDRLPVFVSIAPQKYFVQQIGNGLVDVSVMVPPGASPATYEPKPSQMAAIADTAIYFAVGVPFEAVWLQKIAASNPGMAVVPTDQGIQKIPMAASPHDGQQSPRHPRTPGSAVILDPHIWLSPPLVMLQARTILAALEKADPAHRSMYEANYNAFIAEIIELDATLRNTFKDRERVQFMVFHPAWGYFAHAYGLKQVPIEIEGKDPKPALLQKLIHHARQNGIQVIFVQPQFSSRSAQQVAEEIDGQVAFVDPLALNWAANLREVATQFQAALR